MSKKKLNRLDGLVFSTDPGYMKDDELPEEETLAPAKQRLMVSLDTKHRAGKAVTLVSGFVGTLADLEALGKEVKNQCGTGGSVKDGEIIVQGDHRNKVIQWLSTRGYGVKNTR